jgi:hypothetical protein
VESHFKIHHSMGVASGEIPEERKEVLIMPWMFLITAIALVVYWSIMHLF